MTNWIDLVIDNWPTLAHWASSLGLGAIGGLVPIQLAQKKQRRVLANLQRPILVISIDQADMSHQFKLLERVDLFSVEYSDTSKAVDLIRANHRLVIVGYSQGDSFNQIIGKAKTLNIPVIVYARPGAVLKDDLAQISGYSFASLCNTDVRLVSDVFAIMSTFPEINND
jgi:hypothetical protein